MILYRELEEAKMNVRWPLRLELSATISVDYDRPIVELVEEAGFSTAKIENYEFKVGRKSKAQIFEIFALNHGTDRASKILTAMQQSGLRPANIHELIAFAAAYTNLRHPSGLMMEFAALETNVACPQMGKFYHRGKAYISRSESNKRLLSVRWACSMWSCRYLFLAVPISA